MDKHSKILVLGAGGMVGSAVVKALKAQEFVNVFEHVHDEWASSDLTLKQSVHNLIARRLPQYVFLCAAKVGGIKANNEQPVDFLETNLAIQGNVIKKCHEFGVKRLIMLGSSCIYPKLAKQPISEDSLLTGFLEPTNTAYAIAKIAGIELCRAYNRQHGTDFISVMPCNLYGDNDRYTDAGHVIPMLIQKFRDAIKQENNSHKLHNPGSSKVTAWGTGTPLREFMHAGDLADCLVQLMSHPAIDLPNLINIGSGEEISIRDLTEKIGNIMGFNGEISWNLDMPDGTPRKILDCGLLNQVLPDWSPKISLDEGLRSVINNLQN